MGTITVPFASPILGLVPKKIVPVLSLVAAAVNASGSLTGSTTSVVSCGVTSGVPVLSLMAAAVNASGSLTGSTTSVVSFGVTSGVPVPRVRWISRRAQARTASSAGGSVGAPPGGAARTAPTRWRADGW